MNKKLDTPKPMSSTAPAYGKGLGKWANPVANERGSTTELACQKGIVVSLSTHGL